MTVIFFCVRVNSSCIFHSQLPLTIFIVVFFFAIYCHLLSFLKNQKILLSPTFTIYISHLFHHKYIDKSFTKGNKKQVSLRNQFSCETSFHQFSCQTSFPAKPVSLPSQFPCQTSFPSFPTKPVSLPNQFLRQTSFPAKPVSLPNQLPYQTNIGCKFFKSLM